jgi:acrylyl-CoA reductase (NADPH)
MPENKFKALVVRDENGKFISEVTYRSIGDLPEGDLLIRVKYSSLNYKDALSASGNKGVTRKYPHTPGIDAAGIIEESKDKNFKKGDEVIITGFDLGMNTSGGFGQYIRVPSAWVLKLPRGISLKESMILGTAGLTAGLSLDKLEECGMKPNDDEILVTGASGGVGSLSVLLLSERGYNVTAATGKLNETDFFKFLGAKKIIDRSEVDDKSGKGLLSERWGGAIDTVGGNILSTVLKSTKYGCSVAACGNVASFNFQSTVFPFILRGVNLLGINSERTPMDLRRKIWNKLAGEWKPACTAGRSDKINKLYKECSLEETINKIDEILQGKMKGRILVNPDK